MTNKNKMGVITAPDLKIFCIVMLMKLFGVCGQKESEKKYPHKYGQLIFDKIVKAVVLNRMVFSINGATAIGYL